MAGVDQRRISRAADLQARAAAANAAGKPASGLATCRRALQLLDVVELHPLADDASAEVADLVARIATTAAKSVAELHGLDAGMAMLAWVDTIAGRYDLTARVGVTFGQRGLLLLRFGRTDGALAEFVAAERHFAHVPAGDACKILLNRGVVRLDRMELTLAARDFARCDQIAAEVGDHVTRGMAAHNLGYAEFLAGNLPAALAAMNRARDVSDALPVAIAALDRARVLREAGLTSEADRELGEAVRGFAADRVPQDLAEALVERARCALVAGDATAARRSAARARDIFRRRGNERWRRVAELVLLQGDLAAGRPGSRLVPPALRLAAEFAADGLQTESRLAALMAAEATMTTADGDVTELLARTSRGSSRDPISVRMYDRYVRARDDVRTGRTASAARRSRTGLAELADYQSRFGSLDLQTAAAVHGRRLAELDAEVAVRSGRPAAVFAAIERGRAVSNRLNAVRPPDDEQVAHLLAELRQVSEELRTASGDERHAAAVRRRRGDLERAVTASGWTRPGSREARQPVGLDAVHDLLDAADSVLVSYLDIAGSLYALVVGSSTRVVALGQSSAITERVRRLRADLDVLAQAHLPGALRAGVGSAARASATSLDELLLRPLAIAGRRLVMVSTGVLGQLPWSLLPSLRAVPVVVAPSATAWAAAGRAPVSRADRLTLLAGPGLSHAQREAVGVARAWPQLQAHAGDGATRVALTSALADSLLVHVAAHGTHNVENALFSSLRLADGVLFAHELDERGRVPEHVVLSACELGLASVRPGDEALGLTSVLLRLGTRSVVAGVARVGDETAADVMIDYHCALAGGADSAAALAEATAASSGFAPFVCFGAAWAAGPS